MGRGSVQIGGRDPGIGTGTDLPGTCGNQIGLALQDKKDGRRTGLKLALFALVLRFSRLKSGLSRRKTGTCRSESLQRVAHISLNGHLGLLLLRSQALTFGLTYGY